MKRKSRTTASILGRLFSEDEKARCWICGLKRPEVLQYAHLNQDNLDNAKRNLARLCPTCHRFYDLDLISRARVLSGGRQIREGNFTPDVQAIWDEVSRSGKKANWGVLRKVEKSRGTLNALKAHVGRAIKRKLNGES